MNKINLYPLLLALLTSILTTPLAAQPTRDGHLFDQGRTMTEKSVRAHDNLDKMKNILGQWDVEVTTYPTDSTTHTANGIADVSYMNRGYAYMSRIHVSEFDEAGNEANLMHFLTYSPGNGVWVLGEASSYSESISMYNGGFENGDLVLTTAVRRRGGSLLTMYRTVYSFSDKNTFSLTTSTSADNGSTWDTGMKQVYSRRATRDGFMLPPKGIGTPSPDRPAAGNQFDFLLGEWNATHKINLNGQWIQFGTNATAVHALNGHAILEHSWFNTDPNLPDAATTIVRVYNRSMRRWESLYMTNRSNSPLFFGGREEDGNIVLHNFEANMTDASIPRYVFHDLSEDTYAWYAESSFDRGKTYNKTWTIEFARKQASAIE